MDKTFLPRNKALRRHASELRKQATKEERHLWYDCLRNYPVRFLRQRIIGGYIADFYCEKAKLIVELDGSRHYSVTGEAYDKRRTEYFEQLGLKVLRFTNLDITQNFEGVFAAIDREVNSRIQLL